ncbi:MAG: hypothetical protein C4521_09405 [Actinobacteria bacterium]|nr:MAG: hypothetical protein C4521_09405 [Actinomycetota bacterium]
MYPDRRQVEQLYGSLLEKLGWGEKHLTLFTTNYDPIPDEIMKVAKRTGLGCCDGFKDMGEWDASLYGGDAGIDIYRLHGSMSWVKRNGEIINTRDYSLRRGSTEHLLIYPGYKGNPEEGGEEAFALPHRMLRKSLLTADRLVGIGCSFRDPHINRILHDSAETYRKLNVFANLIVDHLEGFR